jgi:hypothetical protein
MNSLLVQLQNCYGIQSFDHTFDFNEKNSILIYAPNGVMKTSFAKTLLRISNGLEPEEKIYKRESTYNIKVDGTDINKEEILVVEPFNDAFEAKNISTLLVNSEKKNRYDNIYRLLVDAKKKLVVELNKLSGIKKDDIESQIKDDFQCSNIYEVIEKLQQFDTQNIDTDKYSRIKYKQVFDPKVLELLDSPEVIQNIREYTDRYNKLIKESPLFKKGIFNPTNANSISSVLEKENFFKAQHKVLLNGRRRAIKTHKTFSNVIENEKNRILTDAILRSISQKLIGGVSSVKSFQDLLEEYPEVATELSNISKFKQRLWKSYFNKTNNLFISLLNLFNQNKEELKAIEEEAHLEETLWYEAQKVFKDRFEVPFSLEIENHINEILGTTTAAPNIVFTFQGENEERIKFDRGQLNSLDVLSVGERRAMYLLYIIFEFKARQIKNQKTLIVIDDIADSFDYKNKYAIIEYLKEMTEEPLFNLVVLTHNFDFYRTFQSRVLDTAKWENSFVACKNGSSINLLRGGDKNISSPFDLWKSKFSNNKIMLLAMIPFARNLIEYKDSTSCDYYKKLTSMLHIKHDTHSINVSELEFIISTVIHNASLDSSINKNGLVVDLIYEVADSLYNQVDIDEICLANKVALSIAIRLKSEEFMWSQVTDSSPINGTQTGKLFDRLSRQNTMSPDIKQTLGQVILMTPENIHINSFMYEPLVDIHIHHLIRLYEKVKSLSQNAN